MGDRAEEQVDRVYNNAVQSGRCTCALRHVPALHKEAERKSE